MITGWLPSGSEAGPDLGDNRVGGCTDRDLPDQYRQKLRSTLLVRPNLQSAAVGRWKADTAMEQKEPDVPPKQ